MTWDAFWEDAEGLLATACGYTPDQIDQVTLPRFARLARYWQRHPPAHLLLAARFGLTAPRRAGLGELLALFPSGRLE